MKQEASAVHPRPLSSPDCRCHFHGSAVTAAHLYLASGVQGLAHGYSISYSGASATTSHGWTPVLIMIPLQLGHSTLDTRMAPALLVSLNTDSLACWTDDFCFSICFARHRLWVCLEAIHLSHTTLLAHEVISCTILLQQQHTSASCSPQMTNCCFWIRTQHRPTFHSTPKDSNPAYA